MSELTAALATIEKCREVSGCPAGVDLQDHLRQLAAENVALKEACGGNGSYRNCPACTFSEYIEAPETPATDRIVAGIKADGVEEMASTYRGFANKDGCSVNMKCSYNLTAERAESYAAYIRHQMREGAK